MLSKRLSNNTMFNFSFVLVIYILTFFLTSIMPVGILFIVFIFILKDSFLGLRVSIISIVSLINNQYILSGITYFLFNQSKLHVYVIGMLFYIIIFLLIKIFTKVKLTVELGIFIFIVLIVFFMSYQNVFKSLLFLFNVVGSFLSLFILINSLLRYFNLKNINKFKILEKDFFYIILTIIFLSFVIIIIDLSTNFSYLKAQAYELAYFRGNGEVHWLNGIPVQYTTSFAGISFLIRYSGLINGPVRAAYWYFYLSLFLINFNININIKIVMMFILSLFFSVCWSKGVFLSAFFILIFYTLYKHKFYKFSFYLFIFITILFIYLSMILKSSAAVHVLGLLLPFKANLNLNYFIGNNLFKAGNMGRIDGENWMDSVARGAESLVGTYMYAFGLVGVIIFILIHYKTIKLLIKNNLNMVASILTVTLFISFLQEGEYNLLQVFPLLMLLFFLISKQKVKGKEYNFVLKMSNFK